MTVTEATLDAANGSFWSGYNPHTTASISVPAGALAVVVSAIRELHANNAFTVSNSGTARVWTRLNTYAPATDHLVVDYWYNNTGSSVSMTVTVAYVNGDGFNDSVMSWVGAMPGSVDPAVRPPRIVTTISSASTAQASGTPSASGSMFCLHYFQNAPTADVSSLVAGSAVDTSPASTFYFSGGPGSIGTIYQSAMNTQTASPVTVGATLPTSAQTFGILVEYFSAAPVVASSGAIGSVGSGTLAVPVPAGVASGSLIIAYIYAGWFNAATPTTAQFTPPDGTWTIKDIVTHVVSGGQLAMIVAYKYATGSDSGTYAWTVNALGGTGCSFSSGVASRVTGGATSGDPFADAIQKGSAADGSSTVAVASFTPGGDNTLMTGYCDDPDSSPTVTVPSGWSSVVSNSDTTSGGSVLGQVTQSTAAATGTLTFTSTSSTYSKLALVGTFRVPVAAGGGGAPFLAPPGYMTPWAIASRVTLGRRTLASDFTAAPADPEGITDAATPVQDMVRTQADPEGILDAAVPIQGLVRSAADPVGLLDTVAAQQDLVRPLADPIGLLDVASVQQGMARTVVGPVGLLDTASATANNVRLPVDPVGLLDAATAQIGAVRQVDDPVGLLDVASPIQVVVRQQADAIGIIDSASATLSAEYTGFGATFPPAGFGTYTFGADASDVSLGNGIFTSLTGQRCLGARVAIPSDATGTTLTGAVAYLYAGGVGGVDLVSGYPVIGQLITSASFGTLTIGAWNEVRWATPVNLVQNSLYYIIIWLPRNLYGYIHDIFTGGTDVAAPLGGGLTYVGDNGTHHDGVYGYGGVNHVPESDFRAAWYGADGIFDGASGTSYTKSQDDAVGLLDAVSAVLNVVRQQDDPLGIVDTASARQDLVRSVADAVGLLDTASAKQDVVRAQADAVGLLDTASATQGLVRPPADPTGIVDTATAVQNLIRTQADPEGITDSTTASLSMPRQVDDPIGLTDVASVVTDLQRAPVDPIGITDSVSATLTSTGAATVVDQVGLTDSASAKLDSVRSAADQVGLLDAASVGLGFIRTPVDPIGLSDTAAATQQTARTTADSVAITDALALDRALPMNDPTALTDTVTASLGMNREADDSLGLTDSATAFLDRLRAQHDPVGISDSVTAVLIPGEIDYIGTPIDSIGLTDSVVAVLVRGEISKPPDWHDQINGPLIPHRDQGISSLQWHDQINTSAIPSEETE